MKCFVWFAATLSIFAYAQELPVRITVRPQPAYIERTRTAQLVNCDFIVENSSTGTWILHEIEVSAYDTLGELEIRKFVNDNGNSPSANGSPARFVFLTTPGAKALLKPEF